TGPSARGSTDRQSCSGRCYRTSRLSEQAGCFPRAAERQSPPAPAAGESSPPENRKAAGSGAASGTASFLRRADFFDPNLPVAERHPEAVLRNLCRVGRKLFRRRSRRQPSEDVSELGGVVVPMFAYDP